MWTARDATLFLRRETGHPRLVVKLDTHREPDDRRWCVYETLRRYYGPFPFPLGGRCKVARDFDDLIYVLEGPGGTFRHLDPHVMLEALRRQDRWAKKTPAQVAIETIRARRAARRRREAQAFEDVAMESRGMFKRAADEMGL